MSSCRDSRVAIVGIVNPSNQSNSRGGGPIGATPHPTTTRKQTRPKQKGQNHPEYSEWRPVVTQAQPADSRVGRLADLPGGGESRQPPPGGQKVLLNNHRRERAWGTIGRWNSHPLGQSENHRGGPPGKAQR